MKIGEFDPKDRKFWQQNPEPGFSVENNKRVIETTIKKYEKQRAKKMASFTDKLRERTDAAASYLTGMGGAARSRSVEKYFGKTYLAHLRGQNIKNKLIGEQRKIITTKKAIHQEKLSQESMKEKVETGEGYSILRTKTDEQKVKKKQEESLIHGFLLGNCVKR